MAEQQRPTQPALPEFVGWPTFPFEGNLRVKRVDPPAPEEPARQGERGEGCAKCAAPDSDYIWADDRWRVRALGRPSGLPAVVVLETRGHYDMGDLSNLLAAELGVLTVRLERAIRSIDGVARVHVNRWGDGSEHLHVFFLARPKGMLQLRGTFLSMWDDILPPIPEDRWRENLAFIAAWLSEYGGRAVADPPPMHWNELENEPAGSATEGADSELSGAAAATGDPAPTGDPAGTGDSAATRDRPVTGDAARIGGATPSVDPTASGQAAANLDPAVTGQPAAVADPDGGDAAVNDFGAVDPAAAARASTGPAIAGIFDPAPADEAHTAGGPHAISDPHATGSRVQAAGGGGDSPLGDVPAAGAEAGTASGQLSGAPAANGQAEADRARRFVPQTGDLTRDADAALAGRAGPSSTPEAGDPVAVRRPTPVPRRSRPPTAKGVASVVPRRPPGGSSEPAQEWDGIRDRDSGTL